MTLNYTVQPTTTYYKLGKDTGDLSVQKELVQPYTQLPKAAAEFLQEYSTPPISLNLVQPYLTQGAIYLDVSQEYILIRGTKDEFYANFLALRNANNVDWSYNSVKVMLLDNTYPAAQGVIAHQYSTDVQPYEVDGAGYTSGGKVVSVGNTSLYWLTWLEGEYEGSILSDKQHALLTANTPITWTDASFITRYAALYVERTSGGKTLVALLDFGIDIEVNGSFTLPLREDSVVFDVNPDLLNFYNHELERSMRGTSANITAGSISNLRMSLIGDSYTFAAAHEAVDITAHSVKYLELVGCSASMEGEANVIRFPEDRAIFTEVTGTFRYVFFRTALAPEGGLIDLGGNITLSGGDFVFQAPNGVIAAKTRVQ